MIKKNTFKTHMFFIFSKKRFRCLCLIQSHKHSALKTKTGSVLLRSEITMWVCELYTVYYWIRSEQITDLQPRWFFACFYFFSHLDLDKLLMMSIHCWMLMLKQVQECQDELISSKILQKTSASFSWTSSATAAVISPGRKNGVFYARVVAGVQTSMQSRSWCAASASATSSMWGPTTTPSSTVRRTGWTASRSSPARTQSCKMLIFAQQQRPFYYKKSVRINYREIRAQPFSHFAFCTFLHFTHFSYFAHFAFVRGQSWDCESHLCLHWRREWSLVKRFLQQLLHKTTDTSEQADDNNKRILCSGRGSPWLLWRTPKCNRSSGPEALADSEFLSWLRFFQFSMAD